MTKGNPMNAPSRELIAQTIREGSADGALDTADQIIALFEPHISSLKQNLDNARRAWQSSKYLTGQANKKVAQLIDAAGALESMVGRPYGQEKYDVPCALPASCGWPTCECGRSE